MCQIQRVMEVEAGDTAVSVHLVGGVWGLLSPGFLAAQAGYGKTYSGKIPSLVAQVVFNVNLAATLAIN